MPTDVPPAPLWIWAYGPGPGVEQMALDDALLDWVRTEAPLDTLLLRTFTWSEPTLSLGVHQRRSADLADLGIRYGDRPWVRRPTGGRALPHGDDVSFSVLTNRPELWQGALTDSSCRVTRWVQTALARLGLDLSACQASPTAYARVADCLASAIPSDLKDPEGRKRVGTAQLRRQGGMLQQGSVFAADIGLSLPVFTEAMRQTLSEVLGQAVVPWPGDTALPESLLRAWAERQADYALEAASLQASAPTTSGSHFAPASA